MNSLEICSYLVAASQGTGARSIAPATGRDDLAELMQRMSPVSSSLTRPRLLNMPDFDWEDTRDKEYAIWKYTKRGFDYDKAMAENSDNIKSLNALLIEVNRLLCGHDEAFDAPCLNAWGFSMDDVILLPVLRNLSCVAGVEWPARLLQYVEVNCKECGVELYSQHAI